MSRRNPLEGRAPRRRWAVFARVALGALIAQVALIALIVLITGSLESRAAEGGPGVMYRCPGNDYNNTLSAKDAKDRGCRTLEGAPITVIQTNKPRAVPAAGSSPPGSRVEPADQRARDNDARRILEGELQREQDRLAQMIAEYNNGQPERQGNEKNYQKYLDRVADMKTAIARKESDIAAIKRELQKLVP